MPPQLSSLPPPCRLAALPLPPLYRQRTVQAVAGAALSLTATWLAAAPISSFILSLRTGLRVSVRSITLSGARPALRNVTLRAKDGSELAHASLITFGVKKSDKPSPSSDPPPPSITAHDPSFTVVFSSTDLRASNWEHSTSPAPTTWTPRIALTGRISFAVLLAGQPTLAVRATNFGTISLPPVHGLPAANDLVRRFTRTTLRRDVRALPKQFQSAARRIAREAIVSDFEVARDATADVVDELRGAARKIDEALDGLPDLEYYRDIARRSESFLGQIADWLGRGSGTEREHEGEQRGEQLRTTERGYRVLDEDPARSR